MAVANVSMEIFGGYHISYLTVEQQQISFTPTDPQTPTVGIGIQYRKYFHPTQYIGVSLVTVWVGKVQYQSKCRKIPMVAWVFPIFFIQRKRGTESPSRVSLVDYRGHSILDTYVHPTHPIEDYRTSETGLNYLHLCNAPLFVDIQERVAGIIRNKILVGHRIWNFLSALGLSHPALGMRDLALFRPFRKKLKSHSVVDLARLVQVFMERNVGLDYEDSLEFARAAMDLFRSCEEVFEGIVATGEWPCDLPPTTYAEYFS